MDLCQYARLTSRFPLNILILNKPTRGSRAFFLNIYIQLAPNAKWGLSCPALWDIVY